MATSDTKAHIINATIQAIETNGLHNVTTRIIAEHAGVNNAALHYHFGTKEQLVALALQQTIRHADDDLADILTGNEDWKDGLRAALRYLLEGSLRYPNIVRAHLYEAVSETGSHTPFLEEFHRAVDRIIRHVIAHRPETSQEVVNSAVHTALSAGLFSALSPGILTDVTNIRIEDPVSMNGYIQFLTEMICRS